MSAIWLKLVTILCLSCTALTGQENGGVVWRDIGGAITIQCRPPDPDQEFLILKRGLKEEKVCSIEKESGNKTLSPKFKGKIKMTGHFESLDIHIQNLTSEDTGPYLCVYTMFDLSKSKYIENRGNGSVLLVLTDKLKQCHPEDKDLVLVVVVVSAAILAGIIMGCLIWVILKMRRSTIKPRRVATNDVYEDMRGTLRR